MTKGLVVSVVLALAVAIVVFLFAFLMPMAEIVGQEALHLMVTIGVLVILLLLFCILIFVMVLVAERGRPVPLMVEGEVAFSIPPGFAKDNWILLIQEGEDRTKESYRLCRVPDPFLDTLEYKGEVGRGRYFVKIIEDRGGWKRAKIVPLPKPAPLPDGVGGLDSCTKGLSLDD